MIVVAAKSSTMRRPGERSGRVDGLRRNLPLAVWADKARIGKGKQRAI